MRGESIPERGARNLVVMTGGRLAIHAILVVSAFWIPRALGAGAYGRYAAVFAVVQILVMFSTAGLPLVESRQLAPQWRKDRDHAVPLASTIWFSRLGFAVFSGLAAGLWVWFTPNLGQTVALSGIVALLCASRAAAEATRGLFLSIGRAGTLVALDLARAREALKALKALKDP